MKSSGCGYECGLLTSCVSWRKLLHFWSLVSETGMIISASQTGKCQMRWVLGDYGALASGGQHLLLPIWRKCGSSGGLAQARQPRLRGGRHWTDSPGPLSRT